MSVSSNGQICFGILFDEDYEFPWEEYDEEDWYMNETGYIDTIKPYTNGEYSPGFPSTANPFEDPRIKEYYRLRDIHKLQNPMPFELVNYCSGDYPMYILAVPNSVLTCNRGYPQEFNPNELFASSKDDSKFIEFINKYFPDIDAEKQMKWYLSSYMG